MKKLAAIVLLLLGVACIFGAIEAFQMSQELSLKALHMEWDLVNFDLESYRNVVRKEEGYGRMFMTFVAGIILFLGSSGALFVKEP